MERILKSNRPAILLIDHDQKLNERLKNLLSKNFRVVVSTKITHASRMLQNESFQCIVTDLYLGNEKSLNLILEIRNDTNSPNHQTPIILISNMLTKKDVIDFKSLVTTFLVKPFENNELIVVLNRLMPMAKL